MAVRAVAQRVTNASVTVDGEVVGSIDGGLLVYLGVGRGDTEADAAWMAQKLVGLRIFEDEQGKMSRSVRDVGGGVLLVSQFTLHGDVRRGLRPSFDDAAPPDDAVPLLEAVRAAVVAQQIPVATGRFRAEMVVRADVMGPVTILLDSRKTF
jgi:D-tyrosyl-tRNA(Tyr) deacylase